MHTGGKSKGDTSKFSQNSLGGQGFQYKIAKGVSNFVFYCIFIGKFFENVAAVSSPPPPILFAPMDAAYLKRSFILIFATSFMV
jgi:hypothetical protein